MTKTIYTGEELAEALSDGSFEHAPRSTVLVGLIKKSDNKGSVAFTISGCDTWVNIPSNMIESAEHLGFSRCGDHSYAKVKLKLFEPKNVDAKVIWSLLLNYFSRSIRGSTTNFDKIIYPNSTEQGFSDFRVPKPIGASPYGKPLYAAVRQGRVGLETEDGCFYEECGSCGVGINSFGVMYCLQSSEGPNSACVESFCLSVTLGPIVIEGFHR